jgi:hypothetical protein
MRIQQLSHMAAVQPVGKRRSTQTKHSCDAKVPGEEEGDGGARRRDEEQDAPADHRARQRTDNLFDRWRIRTLGSTTEIGTEEHNVCTIVIPSAASAYQGHQQRDEAPAHRQQQRGSSAASNRTRQTRPNSQMRPKARVRCSFGVKSATYEMAT